jgi:hypothetical protein
MIPQFSLFLYMTALACTFCSLYHIFDSYFPSSVRFLSGLSFYYLPSFLSNTAMMRNAFGYLQNQALTFAEFGNRDLGHLDFREGGEGGAVPVQFSFSEPYSLVPRDGQDPRCYYYLLTFSFPSTVMRDEISL